MIRALLYLQYHSFRNRLISRFKRLRQPKYLFGALAGGIYFYFYFFRYMVRGFGSGHLPENPLASYSSLFASFAALILFIVVTLAWIIPHERAALTFSEAEVAFLFPAPVTRRTLIHFKLIRSQLSIFITTFFLTLVSRRFGGHPFLHAVGWWLILSTLNLHFMGSSFMRTILLDHGISNRLRRVLMAALVATAGISIWLWVRKTLPVLTSADTANFASFASYAESVLNTGPALYLLYPFRLVLGPFFAPDTPAFLAVITPALLIFVLHYLWVVFSDVAFEEASLEASQRHAARVAAIRSGNWQAAHQDHKVRREWFKLAATGPAALALMWKNLIGVARVFSIRFWLMFSILVLFCIGFIGEIGRLQNVSLMVAISVASVVGYSLLLGPQFLRLDFRHDLPMADILKTFPMRGWQIVLGEILAPMVVLAGFQWLLLIVGLGLVLVAPGKHDPWAIVIGLSALFVLPVLDIIMFVIPNAAVLLFPSWVQAGKDGPRGIEATGQRVIFAVGQLLVMLVTLLPVTIAFMVTYFPLKFILGPYVPVIFGALAATLILVVEAALGVWWLGRIFERFDVTEEPSS